MQTISRGAGRSAIAAAAYRVGERLVDERTGFVHDFRRRRGVAHSEIVLPAGADPALADRGRLWNLAEAAERRKDAVVAREAVVALPHELSPTMQIDLLRGHAQHIAEGLGVAVDVALHLPGERRRRGGGATGLPGADPRNAHGHLLWTTRRVVGPGIGQKTRALDDRKTGGAIVDELRADWEARVNAVLEDAQIEARVDRRSRAARGDDAAPAPKLGVAAAAMERKGIATNRGAAWRGVRDENAALADVDRVIGVLEGKLDVMRARDEAEREAEEEIEALRARRRELKQEIRPVAPPLDLDAALNRISGGEYGRRRDAASKARADERRAIERVATFRWWQMIPRWGARREVERCTARRYEADRHCAALTTRYSDAAARVLAVDRRRYNSEISYQRNVRDALRSVRQAYERALTSQGRDAEQMTGGDDHFYHRER